MIRLHVYRCYVWAVYDWAEIEARSHDEAATFATETFRCPADMVVVRYVKTIYRGSEVRCKATRRKPHPAKLSASAT